MRARRRDALLEPSRRRNVLRAGEHVRPRLAGPLQDRWRLRRAGVHVLGNRRVRRVRAPVGGQGPLVRDSHEHSLRQPRSPPGCRAQPRREYLRNRRGNVHVNRVEHVRRAADRSLHRRLGLPGDLELRLPAGRVDGRVRRSGRSERQRRRRERRVHDNDLRQGVPSPQLGPAAHLSECRRIRRTLRKRHEREHLAAPALARRGRCRHDQGGRGEPVQRPDVVAGWLPARRGRRGYCGALGCALRSGRRPRNSGASTGKTSPRVARKRRSSYRERRFDLEERLFESRRSLSVDRAGPSLFSKHHSS